MALPEHELPTHGILKRAAAFLEEPGAWMPFATSQDAHGRSVRPWAPEAVRWDIVGALMRAWNEIGNLDDNRAFKQALACIRRAAGTAEGDMNLLAWEISVGRKQSDVIAVLRRAAMLASTETMASETVKGAA